MSYYRLLNRFLYNGGFLIPCTPKCSDFQGDYLHGASDRRLISFFFFFFFGRRGKGEGRVNETLSPYLVQCPTISISYLENVVYGRVMELVCCLKALFCLLSGYPRYNLLSPHTFICLSRTKDWLIKLAFQRQEIATPWTPQRVDIASQIYPGQYLT